MKTPYKLALCIVSIICNATPALSMEYTTHLFGWVSIDYGGFGIAVNDQNLALGETESTSEISSFLWQKNAGVSYISDSNALQRGYGLNNMGYVVGSGQNDTAVVRHPNGSVETLPPPPETVSQPAIAMRINDTGQIVGSVGGDAVYWDTDRVTTVIGDDVVRYAGINASSHAAWTNRAGESYLWSQSAGNVSLAPLTGQTKSSVLGMNDSSLIVGKSGNHAVLWRMPVSPIQLPLLQGTTTACAWGINSSERIVGESGLRAVLWDTDGSILDLSQYVGGYNSMATGINDSGWIVGTVFAPGGDMYAAVWEPIVPEPSSLLVLGSGLMGLAGLIRRRNG